MVATESSVDTLLQEAARLASAYLAEHDEPHTPVVRRLPPAELAARLALHLPARGRPPAALLDDVRDVLAWSVRTGHPRFFNQLFGGHDVPALLGEWVTALLNTSMYTYEAAPVATLMEHALVERLGQLAGFEQGEGVLAPGGSLANLMAVLVARHRAFPHVREEGPRPGERPVLFLSREAHYSLRRAASVAGMGLRAAVDVPTDPVGRMDPEALERSIVAARADGRRPFLVAATAGTTVPGAFDPLDELADLAARHELWLHVDACFGGSVLFSRRHRHLLAGLARADSVSWCPHKMMGVPLSCSALLLRERGLLEAVHGLRADYLFHGREDAAWDLGDKTLQCGRRVDALKLWLSWQATGDEGYERRVDRLFALARAFAEGVRARDELVLVREPQSTNVCFRYRPAALRDAPEAARLAAEGEATVHIRERLMDEGRFLLNYAPLDGAATLRLVASNPRTTEDDLEALLEAVVAAGADLPYPSPR